MLETEVIGFAPPSPAVEEKVEEKETEEEIRKRSAQTPGNGKCKECRQEKPLNRQKLCFPCFVKLNLLDWSAQTGADWIPGDPHPAWCGCGLPEHGGGSSSN